MKIEDLKEKSGLMEVNMRDWLHNQSPRMVPHKYIDRYFINPWGIQELDFFQGLKRS